MIGTAAGRLSSAMTTVTLAAAGSCCFRGNLRKVYIDPEARGVMPGLECLDDTKQ